MDSEKGVELGTNLESERIVLPARVVEAKPKVPAVEPKPEPPLLGAIAKQAKLVGAVAKRVDEERWQVIRGDRVLNLTDKSRKAELDETVLFLSDPFSRRKGFFGLSD
ncbi:MAG: hypothetical protein HOA81_00215, partial [Opitutales bacterium]|nr:hypothetical protein [Opitutales bacterium]